MRCPLNYIGVTQEFKKGKHNGVDFGWNNNYGGKNAPIYAPLDGRVIAIQKQTTGGNVLHIYHQEEGICTEYGHLSEILVNVGDKVTKGQQVAKMGNTGVVNGVRVAYHLHFGVYKGAKINYSVNKWVNPLDYMCVYKDQTISPKETLKLNKTKVVTGVPSEPLIVHNARNYRNSSACGNLYNGNEVEYYGSLLGIATIDNLKGRYCSNRYLK